MRRHPCLGWDWDCAQSGWADSGLARLPPVRSIASHRGNTCWGSQLHNHRGDKSVEIRHWHGNDGDNDKIYLLQNLYHDQNGSICLSVSISSDCSSVNLVFLRRFLTFSKINFCLFSINMWQCLIVAPVYSSFPITASCLICRKWT